MVKTMGDQTKSAKLSILLGSVGASRCSGYSTVTDHCAMVQLPPKLCELSEKRIWRPVRDEIRRLADMHNLADIPVKVEICVGHVDLFATCEFKHRDDAREVFSVYPEGLCFSSPANSVG